MTINPTGNSFNARQTMETGSGQAHYYSLQALTDHGFDDPSRLPFSLRVLLEAVLRNENGFEVTAEDVKRIASYNPLNPVQTDIPYKPSRVLLQDFTGVPAVVDLAAMRSAMARIGGDPERINPLVPVDLVIDHSVQIDAFGSSDAFKINTDKEFYRNQERYQFLKWGQNAFRNFRVIPPGSGICHQINLEYLGNVVQSNNVNGDRVVFPDTVVGTDSHTTMINGIGVLGWGVGGIEAEAVMLGQPIYMLIPDVVGVKLSGELPEGATATDMVLRITEVLRQTGVVGKFVEYFGPGLGSLTVPDRATLSNMSPEYGATVGFFPVDAQTLEFLTYTGRNPDQVKLVERYCKEQGLFHTENTPDPLFKKIVELDLSTIEPSLSGPKRPQDRIALGDMKSDWRKSLTAEIGFKGFGVSESDSKKSYPITLPSGDSSELSHGDVLISAITSCTNTSNPAVMIAAGLLAKRAVEAGLSVSPKTKTSLAPGSKVATDYLTDAGLLPYLEQLGFHVVGYGCTTCIGNSGPIAPHFANAVDDNGIIAASVLSGNRNFTGRINPHTKASYLASPPLVVAFALAGTVDIDMTVDPIGKNSDGKEIYLKDLWPTSVEISENLGYARNVDKYRENYTGIEESNPEWNAIETTTESVFNWDASSTYIQEPEFFMGLNTDSAVLKSIENARVLIIAGDSITTDHISPAGNIPADGAAGQYLIENGVEPSGFNSFGSRRGNDRVMTRGTFANITFRNKLADGKEGGWTRHFPSGEMMSIYEASKKYKSENAPLVAFAGKDYGMGSSRDWAAKGTLQLGIKAVIAESFERIHRSNLVGMGVLPLQFKDGDNPASLGLDGSERISIAIDDSLSAGQSITVKAESDDGKVKAFEVLCRIDTPIEVEYYRNGGILHTVLMNMFKES